jgi:hypothetical protein
MKRLILLLAIAAPGWAQLEILSEPAGGVASLTCAAIPGNTTGNYLQTCTTPDCIGGFVCANTSNCTTAADWVIAWPQPVTDHLVFFLKGNCVTQYTCATPSNGTSMATSGIGWFDSAGNMSSISAGLGTPPTYATNQMANGYGAWTFTNSGNTIANLPTTSGATTSILVLKPTTVSTQQVLIGSTANASANFFIDNTGHLGFNARNITAMGTSTTALSAGTWYLVQASNHSGSGAVSFRINNAADATVSPSNGTITANITYVGYDGGNVLQSTVFAVMFYTKQLSTAESQQNYGYLHLLSGGTI